MNNHWKPVFDDEISIEQLYSMRQRIKELENEVGFWMGEFQYDRPEIVEYRALAIKDQLTSEETNRMTTIAKQIRIEKEE